MNFSYDGFDFNAYLGLSSDKCVEITQKRVAQILLKIFGKDEAAKILDTLSNSEDVNTNTDLILEMATVINRSLRKKPLQVYVSRTKNEESGYWEVKWYLDKVVSE